VRLLELTLSSPAENLALDEALLDDAEDGGEPREWLRLWEPAAPLIVVGRSSRLEVEVHAPRCRELGIPILRRCSGGAAIVSGPGCLMYAVVLSLQRRPELCAIDLAHRFVLETVAAALHSTGLAVARRGTSDLALSERKFSGNSLRVRRLHLLYHGTLLYNFRLQLIAQCLGTPPHQPEYRAGREHAEFVTNLPLPAADLRRSLIEAWRVTRAADHWPQERLAELVASKYSRPEWNFRR
jgi:lipoate-protein ligase A